MTPSISDIDTHAPAALAFDSQSLRLDNAFGTGTLSVQSANEAYRLSATLTQDEPDCSNEDRQASAELQVTLEGPATDKTVCVPYEYHGSNPAGHLRVLFDDGTLMQMLDESPEHTH